MQRVVTLPIHSHAIFTAHHTEGAILPTDPLQRVANGDRRQATCGRFIP